VARRSTPDPLGSHGDGDVECIVSWDVVLLAEKRKPNEERPPARNLGEASEVRRRIAAALPGTDWSDPAWGVLESDGWSIEFNSDAAGEVESLMLHVRGEGNPVPAIARLCQETGWFALDMSSAEFLEPANPNSSGWEAFRDFRDTVASQSEASAEEARSGINWTVVIIAVLLGLVITIVKLVG